MYRNEKAACKEHPGAVCITRVLQEFTEERDRVGKEERKRIGIDVGRRENKF